MCGYSSEKLLVHAVLFLFYKIDGFFFFVVSSFLASLNLAALCVCLELIESESLLTCPFPLSGFYPRCDLVILVNYPCLCEFWLLFKVHAMRNVYLITSLISNFLA